MAKRNTSIQINGKSYDALTGALLSPAKVTIASRPVRSIDGVVKSKVMTAHTLENPVIKKPRTLPPNQVARTTGAHVKAHHVTASATLMRHAVKKPTTASVKRRATIQVPVITPSLQISPSATVVAKTSIARVNSVRLNRATQTVQSAKVSHFKRDVSFSAPTPIAVTQTVSPVAQLEAKLETEAYKAVDVFEQALARATSHEQPAPPVSGLKKQRSAASKKARRRMATYAASGFAVLVIAGAFGYQNLNGVKLHMAASKAGFSATMPGYTPAGFSVANFRSGADYVGLDFTSTNNTQGTRSFALTEKPTNWNSETLLSNILSEAQTSAYNTLQAAGRTVYVYGQNQAAWVDNGILYQVLGNGALNTQEFGKIAASM